LGRLYIQVIWTLLFFWVDLLFNFDNIVQFFFIDFILFLPNMSKALSYCARLGGFICWRRWCGVGFSVEQSKSGGGFLLIGGACGVGFSVEPAKKAGGCLERLCLLVAGSCFAFAFAGPLGFRQRARLGGLVVCFAVGIERKRIGLDFFRRGLFRF